MKDSSTNCDQFSDIMSTSSRSTASTISSTRSCKSIPDKVDIISFNAEGNLRKSVRSFNHKLLNQIYFTYVRPTNVMTYTAWTATTSSAVWKISQFKFELVNMQSWSKSKGAIILMQVQTNKPSNVICTFYIRLTFPCSVCVLCPIKCYLQLEIKLYFRNRNNVAFVRPHHNNNDMIITYFHGRFA